MRFLFVLAVTLGATWYYHKPLPPGKGPSADAGKRQATVVLRGLESYRGDHGAYPEDLEALVPEYLSKLPLLSNGSPFDYQRLGTNYRLTFNYTNPFPIHCTYEPTTRWDCDWF